MSDASKNIETSKLTREDFNSSLETRWCPGCGDYSILAQFKKILPDLNIPKEDIVFVSGIGCSSRFPYYVDTYGFHGIHGRAPVIASGIKTANPKLKVFVVTGDGDGLSIGGNHFIHLFRRNIDVTVVMFNNRIYGLTKGQYSPTSEKGKVTKTSPYGTVERPFSPVEMALASGATFVAKSIDRNPKHLAEMLKRAAEHKGASFVEVYQNCPIFNDGAYTNITDPKIKDDNLIIMENGKPYIFGKDRDKVLTWIGKSFEVLKYDKHTSEDALTIHNESSNRPALEFMLVSMAFRKDLPTPIGVFRDLSRPTYEAELEAQIKSVTAQKGEGNLERLLFSGNTWAVE
jgi:2-oxoglutarate ferredoxin oxidoreductase subunit beta